MAYRLPDEEIVFPRPQLADEDGLLAVGGDLSIERLLLAYRHGIFPWYNEPEPILWYSPKERCVIYPHKLKISKSLKQTLRKGHFTVSVNRDFTGVIAACANIKRKAQEGTWINSKLKEAFIRLHQLKWAHSIEVWQNDELVGGLYGISIGQVFCGESMFSKVSDASKVAMVYLCQNTHYKLIDCQIPNDHLYSLGAELIAQADFMAILTEQHKASSI